MERKVFLLTSVLLIVLVFEPCVYCGQCSTNDDCVETDFTSAVCTSGVCGCKLSNFASIRTGCGKTESRLTKPVAAPETGRNNDIFVGKQGVLTCSTIDGATSYAWYYGGTRTNDITQNITITKSGSYECQALANTERLNSDKSDALVIKDITSTCYYKMQELVIDAPKSNVLNSYRDITLSCTNLPLGYNGTITFKIGGNVVAEVTSSLSIKFELTSTSAGKTMSCHPDHYDGIFIFTNGQVVLPTVDTNLAVTSVQITVEDSMGPISDDTTYNVGADGPTLTCTTTPKPDAFDTSKILIYEFLDDAATPNSKQRGSSNTYKVQTTVISVTKYRCRVDSAESVLSIAISFSDNFFAVPTVMKASAIDLGIGTTLVLSCGDSTYDADSYQWSFNEQTIDGQIDKKIQLYNFNEADIGVYKCRAVKSRYTTTYGSSFVALMKPTITRETPGASYEAGGDYALKCNSGSIVTAGWTFLWKKDGNNTTTQTASYTISDAAATAHNGVYTCTTSYNGLSSTSDALTITLSVIKLTVTCECCGTFFGRYGNYVLKCNSNQKKTTGWTYSWKKNSEETAIKKDTYDILDAREATHNGVYTCTTSYNGVSNTSDTLTITIEDPGKRCTTDADCTGYKYTGKCTTTSPKVCDCATPFKLKGDDCVSGAVPLISSLLMITLLSLNWLVF